MVTLAGTHMNDPHCQAKLFYWFASLDLAVEPRPHPPPEDHEELGVDGADEGGRQVEPDRRREHGVEDVLERYDR